MQYSSKQLLMILFVGMLCLALSMGLGLCFGSSHIPLSEIWNMLLGRSSDYDIIFWNLRIPRVLMACHVGAVLAISGLAFQSILKNPLAEPYILGVSGGAAVGVIISILWGFNVYLKNIFAFSAACLTLFIILALGKRQKNNGLLLSGVMINAFCGAIILFLTSLAESHEIGNIMFWYMGNIGNVSIKQVYLYTLILSPMYLILLLYAHKMNIVLLGEETAQSLGVNTNKVRLILLIIPSIMISSIVAVVGPFGFVGLVIPQALRLVIGQDHRFLAPSSLLFGASFLVICDMLARTLPKTGEIPVGVLTALIGAPIFIYLLRKKP